METWNTGNIRDFADVKGGKRLPKGKQSLRPTMILSLSNRDLSENILERSTLKQENLFLPPVEEAEQQHKKMLSP